MRFSTVIQPLLLTLFALAYAFTSIVPTISSGPPPWWDSYSRLAYAIKKYQETNGKLTGTSQAPLVGKVITSPILDLHGRPYLIDSQVGVIVSFGRDGIPGGQGDDADLVSRYDRTFEIVRVRYRGQTGHPCRGSLFEVQFSKPFAVRPGGDPADDLLLVDRRSKLSATTLSAGTFELVNPADDDINPGSIWLATRFKYRPLQSDPIHGRMVLEWFGARGDSSPPWAAGFVCESSILDIHPRVRTPGGTRSGSNSCIIETPIRGGPLAQAISAGADFRLEGATPTWWTMGTRFDHDKPPSFEILP